LSDNRSSGHHSSDWSTPAVEAVAPGIHRIPLPIPDNNLHAVNVYAIEDGDGFSLIDAGWSVSEAEAQLQAGMRSLGAELSDIRRFIVTHHHHDHYTLAVMLRQKYGTPISLGAGEEPIIQGILDGWAYGMTPQFGRLRAAGAQSLIDDITAMTGTEQGFEPEKDFYELPDTWLSEGDELSVGGHALSVMESPGHTAGHVVFSDVASGILFSGDHVLPHITPSISFESVEPVLPLKSFLESLDRVLALPDLRLLPAHGPITSSSHARALALIEHHATRLDEVYATVVDGAITAADSAAKLVWTRRGRALKELDTINQMLAVNETQSHLLLLVDQGRLTDRRDGELILYSTP
jgi:glyoxylase-like metal-dependent hydrolase (beta-lactamase superfamily II)